MADAQRFAGSPEDNLLVDTGVLVAGGHDQAVHQMVSLLYRNFQTIPGPNPATLAGGDAVAGGGATIVQAVVEGKRAGQAIDEYLRGLAQ